jgi:outer membrane protein OmpA-like peptidoglycan-associated protein
MKHLLSEKSIWNGGCKLTIVLGIVVLSLCCLLGGCSREKPYYKRVWLMNGSDYQGAKAIKALQGKGVDVQWYAVNDKRGHKKEYIKLLIPVHPLFNKDSANLSASAYSVLDLVVSLLNCYDQDVVQVKGSARVMQRSQDQGDAEQYAKALALLRAQGIVKYLWSQEVGATLIYADSEQAPQHYAEITFKKQPY